MLAMLALLTATTTCLLGPNPQQRTAKRERLPGRVAPTYPSLLAVLHLARPTASMSLQDRVCLAEPPLAVGGTSANRRRHRRHLPRWLQTRRGGLRTSLRIVGGSLSAG